MKNTTIYSARLALGISTTAMAEKMCIAKRTWEVWENGQRKPDKRTLMQIAQLINQEGKQDIVGLKFVGDESVTYLHRRHFIELRKLDDHHRWLMRYVDLRASEHGQPDPRICECMLSEVVQADADVLEVVMNWS